MQPYTCMYMYLQFTGARLLWLSRETMNSLAVSSMLKVLMRYIPYSSRFKFTYSGTSNLVTFF